MAVVRRFAIPVISFLFGAGLQVSGIEAPLAAAGLWILAAIWGFAAFVTWQPVRERASEVRAWVGEHSPFIVHVERRRKPPVAVDDTPMGYLDFEAEAELAMHRMTKHLGTIGKETASIGNTFARDTPRVTRLASASGVDKRGTIRDVGNRIDKHSTRMEELQPKFRAEIELTSENYLKRLDYANAEGVASIRPSLAGMAEAIKTARPSAVGLRNQALSLRNQNVQQALNRATQRLVDALGRLISDFDALSRFTTAALRKIDDKIAAEKPVPSNNSARRRTRKRTPRSGGQA